MLTRKLVMLVKSSPDYQPTVPSLNDPFPAKQILYRLITISDRFDCYPCEVKTRRVRVLTYKLWRNKSAQEG